MKILNKIYLLLFINIFVINISHTQFPIKRIPAYMYFNGMHQTDDYKYYAQEYNYIYNTKNLKKIINGLNPGNKQEFINQLVAYLVVEAVLLEKPLSQLTVKDIASLNAIFLYKLPIDPERCFENYIPGMFRKDFRLKSRFDGFAWDHLNDDELKIWAHIVVRSKFRNIQLDYLYNDLSQEEKIVVNKLYSVYKPVEQIEEEFNLLIENLSNCVEENTFSLAARMHFKITEIHPFCDGNGRTSRLFMNIILMHRGFLPIFIDDKRTYINIMQTTSLDDYSKLALYIRLKTNNLTECLNNFNNESGANALVCDLFGFSIYQKFPEDDNWRELIKSIFEKINPQDSNTLETLETLFEIILEKLKQS